MTSQDPLPFELKTLIYSSTPDTETIKSLRLASKSWASAGLPHLLLPTCTIKSASDLQRLVHIGGSPGIAEVARKTVRTLVFPVAGWSSRYFRWIVCNRHVLRERYEEMDYVPTEAESLALHALDAFIIQHDLDDLARTITQRALSTVPNAHSIHFIDSNPFDNPILRKCWEEYSIQAFSEQSLQTAQLKRILGAAKAAGLPIRALKHDQLMSDFVHHVDLLHGLFDQIEVLDLFISDIDQRLTLPYATKRLKTLLSTCEKLTELTLSFQGMGEGISLEVLPDRMEALHTLSFSGPQMLPSVFLPWLALHKATLRRLRLSNCSIPEGEGTWRTFLSNLQDLFSGSLDRFVLMGMVKSEEGGVDEKWFLRGVPGEPWSHNGKYVKSGKYAKSGLLEDFVLKGTQWPMSEEDRLPFGI